MRTGKKKSKKAILATTVRRGIWRSNPAYRDVSVELRFPPFDILVMNAYAQLVAAGGASFWRMKASSNGSFFLFPMKNQKAVIAVLEQA